MGAKRCRDSRRGRCVRPKAYAVFRNRFMTSTMVMRSPVSASERAAKTRPQRLSVSEKTIKDFPHLFPSLQRKQRQEKVGISLANACDGEVIHDECLAAEGWLGSESHYHPTASKHSSSTLDHKEFAFFSFIINFFRRTLCPKLG